MKSKNRASKEMRKRGMCLPLRYGTFPSTSQASFESDGYSRKVTIKGLIMERRSLALDKRNRVANTATGVVPRLLAIFEEWLLASIITPTKTHTYIGKAYCNQALQVSIPRSRFTQAIQLECLSLLIVLYWILKYLHRKWVHWLFQLQLSALVSEGKWQE